MKANVMVRGRPMRSATGMARFDSYTQPGPLGPAVIAAAVVAIGGVVAMAEGQGVVVAASLLACMFIMLEFRVGVVCLILLMPLSASSLFPHAMGGITGLNPLNVLLLATLASLMLQRGALKEWSRLPSKQLLLFYLAPLMVAGLMGMRHVDEIPASLNLNGLIAFDSAFGYFRDMVMYPMLIVVFSLLVAAAVARSRRPRLFLLPMIASIWLMSLVVIGFVFLSGATLAEMSSAEARGFFVPLGIHANDLGRLFAVAYALVLFPLPETRDGGLRLLLAVTAGIIVLALTLTFSRGAFLGFFVVNGIFLITRRNAVAMIIGLLFLIALAVAAPEAVYERLSTGMDGDVNALTAGRVDEIWMPLLPELLNSPLWGNGLGAILWSAPQKAGRILEVTHPHNAYLQVLLDMGLLGAGLIAAFFRHIWRSFREQADNPNLTPVLRGFHRGAMAGLASFLVAGFAGSSLYPCFEQMYIWFAVGVVYGLRYRQQEGVQQ